MMVSFAYERRSNVSLGDEHMLIVRTKRKKYSFVLFVLSLKTAVVFVPYKRLINHTHNLHHLYLFGERSTVIRSARWLD